MCLSWLRSEKNNSINRECFSSYTSSTILFSRKVYIIFLVKLMTYFDYWHKQILISHKYTILLKNKIILNSSNHWGALFYWAQLSSLQLYFLSQSEILILHFVSNFTFSSFINFYQFLPLRFLLFTPMYLELIFNCVFCVKGNNNRIQFQLCFIGRNFWCGFSSTVRYYLHKCCFNI